MTPAPEGANLPPQDLDAEEAVLGAMMINDQAVLTASEIISDPGEFYREAHGTVYRSILALLARSEPIDAVTVSDELERMGALDQVGGRGFIFGLSSSVTVAANVKSHAQIVRDLALLRRVAAAGLEIAELGYQHPGETRDLLDRCEQKVFAIQQQRRVAEFQHIKEVLIRNFEYIDSRGRESGMSGAASGFEGIDKLTGGFQKANLIVLAARPGVGKTSLALNIAQNVAVEGKSPVAIFSLEMSAQELGERMMCSSARVSSHKVRTGALSGDDYAKLVQAAGELEKADIFIDDTAGLNMFELRAKARRLQAKQPLALVIVDYLQLMAGDSRAENRQQEVSNISRSLKQLARELEAPVIAVSQLNRAPEQRADREPQLADLRESGAIEQDADMVMFIYEDPSDPASKGVVKLKIAKHRNGPTGLVRLGFVRDYTKFRTLSQAEDYDYEE